MTCCLSRFWRACGAAAGLMILAAVGLSGCGQSTANMTPPAATLRPAREVTTLQVLPRTLRRTLTVVGTVAAKQVIELRPRAELVVVEVRADEGDAVRAGQVLVRFDEVELRLDVANARAALAAAQAQLDQRRRGFRQEEIATARAQRDQAKAQLSTLEADAPRMDNLKAASIITAQEYDSFRSRLEAARAGLAMMQSELSRLESGYRLEEIEGAAADVERAQATLALATERLGYATMTAPIDGVVVKRSLELGERVTPQEVVYTVSDPSRLWVLTQIPEMRITEVAVGQPVTLTNSAFAATFVGKVAVLGEHLDETTRTLPIKVEVTSGTDALKPGMFVHAVLGTGVLENVILLPRDVVRYEKGKASVFIVNATETVREQRITFEPAEGEQVRVLEGLTGQEQLAASAVDLLHDGDAVKAN